MKKLLTLTLVFGLLLVACSGNKTAESKSKAEAPKEEKKEESNKIELNKPMKVGKYTVTFTEYKILEDYNKKPVLRITYDWKNEGDKSTYPFTSFSVKAFQDGVETDKNYSLVKGVELGTGQKEVKPGGEVKGAHTVIGITSLDKPLKLEVEETFSFKDEKFEAELNLGDYK